MWCLYSGASGSSVALTFAWSNDASWQPAWRSLLDLTAKRSTEFSAFQWLGKDLNGICYIIFSSPTTAASLRYVGTPVHRVAMPKTAGSAACDMRRWDVWNRNGALTNQHTGCSSWKIGQELLACGISIVSNSSWLVYSIFHSFSSKEA